MLKKPAARSRRAASWWFENSEHEWTAKPGPQTNRAYEMVKSLIACNVSS
jgi:hypothetical protein